MANDLRKAAEMALEALERLDRWLALRYGNELTQPEKDVVEELRKALAHEESEVTRLRQVCRNVYEVWAGSEGIPMPETCAERYLLQLVEQMRDEAKEGLPVDAVNMSQDRVDETAKGEHEPVAFRNTETGEFCTGGFLRKDLAKWQPVYTTPVACDDDIYDIWVEQKPVHANDISQECVDETAKGEHEPVAWMHNFIEGTVITHEPADIGRHPDRWTPLYTAPPKREWVGLTDEAIWLEYQHLWPFHPAEEPTLAKDIAKFARAIEAKLKEKNGG